MKSCLIFFAICLGFSTFAKAQSLDFDFSFTGLFQYEGTQQSGTISGELIGLQNNASSSPTEVIIKSAPSEMFFDAPDHLPYAISSFSIPPSANTIAISNYTVTAANLDLESQIFPNAILQLNDADYMGRNGFEYGGLALYNQDGFAGATYTYVGLAAPEPGSLALMLVAGVIFGCCRYFSLGRYLPGNSGNYCENR
jgi:hypothetical protein